MKKKLYIIGAGSVGGHVASNFDDFNLKDFELAGFLDDDEKKIGTSFCNVPVIDEVNAAISFDQAAIVVGIAFPEIKKKIVTKLSANKNLEFPTLIHNRAWVSNGVSIGNGSIIYPGTSINYGSEIGEFVVMNMNCALGHHTKIKNYSSLAPGVNTGGHTIIEESCDIGIGASTVQNVNIGQNSVIGAQALVLNDFPKNSTAVGVPAENVEKRKSN